jgi:pyrimidine-nucleoside phosphorylase
MRPVDLIRKKRDGHELSRAEISFVIAGYTAGEIPDYQVSALLMACVLRGLSDSETASFTESMLDSGKTLDLSAIAGRKVDKHSTGGVGDKTSLLLVPIIAAAGLKVPMISGRGLGHTGGTLDKLEAIPGFNVNLDLAATVRVLREVGGVMIGQTAEIAPADKKLYALRDVTATVECPGLICASIMSKKLAEGIDALVLDVKTGSGAFMESEADAVSLAELMVATGERIGKRMAALITSMDQPLGHAIGNAVEVEECIRILRGESSAESADLIELTVELAAWMLLLGERATDIADGRAIAKELLASGAAIDVFRRLIAAHGGDARVLNDTSLLPKAQFTENIRAKESGYISGFHCRDVGVASVMLGGGREKKEDAVDAAVGILVHKKIGDLISSGDSVFTVHHNRGPRVQDALALLSQSFSVSQSAAPAPQLVRRVISHHESLINHA